MEPVGNSAAIAASPAVAEWISGELPADGRGEIDVDAPGEQLGLPQAMLGRIEILHGKQHRRVVVRNDPRRDSGNPGAGRLVPEPLIAVPFDRREPVVLDGELGHRPLDAEDAAADGHLPDIGGDAAGEALRRHRLIRMDESEAGEARVDCSGEIGRHGKVGTKCGSTGSSTMKAATRKRFRSRIVAGVRNHAAVVSDAPSIASIALNRYAARVPAMAHWIPAFAGTTGRVASGDGAAPAVARTAECRVGPSAGGRIRPRRESLRCRLS